MRGSIVIRRTVTIMQVNSNGLLSFRTPFNSSPLTLPLSTDNIVIASFWDDVGDLGQIYTRSTTEAIILNNIQSFISTAFQISSSLTSLFIVTWEGVPESGSSSTVRC